MEQVVYIHSASALARVRPEWVVYQDLFEVTGGKVCGDDQSLTVDQSHSCISGGDEGCDRDTRGMAANPLPGLHYQG